MKGEFIGRFEDTLTDTENNREIPLMEAINTKTGKQKNC